MNVVSFDKKLIILTPPKCSTYSLIEFLNKGGIKLDNPLRDLSTIFYHSTLSEILYAYNIPINKVHEYKIIQITRNPYERFISAFFHQQKILNTDFSIDILISKLENFKYLLLYNVDEFYIAFYGSLNYKQQSFLNNNWGGLRFFYEQNWWNNVNAEINYFKLEDISKDSTSLCNSLHIKPSFYPKINSNKNSKFSLNTNQKNRIYNLFKNDFKLFNYKK